MLNQNLVFSSYEFSPINESYMAAQVILNEAGITLKNLVRGDNASIESLSAVVDAMVNDDTSNLEGILNEGSMTFFIEDAVVIADEVGYDYDSDNGFFIDVNDLNRMVNERKYELILSTLRMTRDDMVALDGIDISSVSLFPESDYMTSFTSRLLENSHSNDLIILSSEGNPLNTRSLDTLIKDIETFKISVANNRVEGNSALSGAPVGRMNDSSYLLNDHRAFNEHHLNHALASRYPSLEGMSINDLNNVLYEIKRIDPSSVSMCLGDFIQSFKTPDNDLSVG